MSLDGKLLRRARGKFEENRRANQAGYAKRLREIYEKSPRIRELDAEIKGTVADAVGYALSHGRDPVSALEELKEKSLLLQGERAEALAAMGYPIDYLDEKYLCEKCHDTGYIGTEICSCLRSFYEEEQRLDLSALLKLGQETFDSFKMEYYEDLPDEKTGISPRSSMRMIYEMCVEYARKFSSQSYNLLFSGGTGLGKTFLSTCIAKVVSENGWSVVYDTASSICSKLEDGKFARGENYEDAQNDIRRYLSCDLLIIDDLGTEFMTVFVMSALYDLINTRLVTNKKTIMSTNLSINDIRKRYPPQIASRILGEYSVFPFFGHDIRMLKNEK